MSDRCATRYPIVLVPGMLGFVRLVVYPYWFGIAEALRREGATVHIVQVSMLNSSEVRGEQLLRVLEDLHRHTGAERFNLIGHSQGALTARYAAAVRPERVASVTSVAGPNHGSELADHVDRRLADARLTGHLLQRGLHGLALLMGLLDTGYKGPRLPIDVQASHRSLTSAGVERFNRFYPQGLPTQWGGQGPAEVNGVRYYSWSGVLQDRRSDGGGNRFDSSHYLCRRFARTFVKEAGQCDGMVGRFSSHLGEVIGDDYPLDHLDIVNQSLGRVGRGAEPVRLFVEHAVRLRLAER